MQLRPARDEPPSPCHLCGRPTDAHNRHVRFQLPDAVLAVPVPERAERTWETATLMQVEGIGAFVRALLPVRLLGGHQLTFGLWLGVPTQDMHRALKEWWTPGYPDLVLDGLVANDVQPWGLLGKPCRAVVRDPDETPYLDSSSDELMQAVLVEEWPHDLVMDALPASVR